MTTHLYRDTDIEFCPQCGESAEGVNSCDCLSDEQQEVEDRIEAYNRALRQRG